MRRIARWLREFFCGRPVTKNDILQDRLRLCAAAGIRPEDIQNFWVGIEELREAHRRIDW